MSSPPPPPQPTLAEIAEQFLLHCRLARNLAANTLRAYAADLAEFCRFAGGGTEIAACD